MSTWDEVRSSEAFARRLENARRSAGMRQLDLAKAAGIQQSNICNYESGKTMPMLSTVGKLAKALGVSIEYLSGSVGKEESFRSDDCIPGYRNLTSEQKKTINILVKTMLNGAGNE